MPAKPEFLTKLETDAALAQAVYAVCDTARVVDDKAFTFLLGGLTEFAKPRDDTDRDNDARDLGKRLGFIRVAHQARGWLESPYLPPSITPGDVSTARAAYLALVPTSIRADVAGVLDALDTAGSRAEFVKAMQYPAVGEPPDVVVIALAAAVVTRLVLHTQDAFDHPYCLWTVLGGVIGNALRNL
jgi:hypothetical protein